MKSVPTHIHIGGIEFEIVVKHLPGGDYGQMDFDERKIYLSTICLAKRSTLRETLRHELVHAALHICGISFSEKYDEEIIVRAMDHIFFPAWEKLRTKI
jgi:hypothetical protein